VSQLIAAALTFLLAVGALLGTAAWNRTDSATIVLTERELPVVVEGGRVRGAEDAIRLEFRVQPRSAPDESRLWLSDATLREIGFALGVPAGAPDAAQFYLRALPRQVWVAFEMDGEAFAPMARQLALGAMPARAGRWPALDPSRLVPIDAGLNRAYLQARWRERPVLVIPAVVAMRYEQHPTRGPSVWGQITTMGQSTVQVPQRLRQTMARAGWLSNADDASGQASEAPRAPRYDVVLGVGRLGAVWVEDVRPHRK
jgi:hypothetical protein